MTAYTVTRLLIDVLKRFHVVAVQVTAHGIKSLKWLNMERVRTFETGRATAPRAHHASHHRTTARKPPRGNHTQTDTAQDRHRVNKTATETPKYI